MSEVVTVSILLEMASISKSFGPVRALKSVSINLNAGEVLALMGEDGAGKSTLMNILSGGLGHFSGTIYLDGKAVEVKNPIVARRLGIAMIHQELQLVPYMTVAENIFMGRELAKLGVVNSVAMNREAKKYLQMLEMDIDPRRKISDLRVGEQQMVEIAKALSYNAKILIMDEPTSAISKTETQHLFRVIQKLKTQDVGIIYITHRMEEVFEIADRIMVMRDGELVDTILAENTTRDQIISMMVGRDIVELFPKSHTTLGEVALKVENLYYTPPKSSFKRSLQDVSFEVRRGEILGIAGLMGAGRSELCECLFGVHPKNMKGSVYIEGVPVKLKSPRRAIAKATAFATEDRKGQGLVLFRSIGENMSLPLLKQFSPAWIMKRRTERVYWNEQKERLRIKARSADVQAGQLSGGNQQKVILGRWLLTKPKILILDEPTRGIDVGAKTEIYQLINDLAAQGIAIVMVSSELPELLGLSDRIITFCEGRMTGEFTREEATQENLLQAATRREDKAYA